MASIKQNFGYNLILTGCNYIFPLIVFPYITRVLDVPNIGICDYVDSIIQYFILFSMLGVSSLGVREIARCKDDSERRSCVFSTLVSVNLVLTLISIGVLVFISCFVEKFYPYRPFLLVGISKLLFQVFVVDWFYQGLQEFRYVTIRSIAVRCIYVALIFLFVHSPQDTLVYYVLTCLVTVFNALCNWIYSRKFSRFRLRNIRVGLYAVPILVFGYYRILTSLYTTFNTFFLGYVQGDTEVGYFSTATKMNTLIMAVFTALTTVLVPKVAQLIEDKDYDRLRQIADKTFSLIYVVSIPVISYCVIFAPEIIGLITGPGFEGAILPFRIIIFLILVIGLEQIVIQQFLMASVETRSIAIVSTVGAVVGLSLNFILTPRIASVGSAIAWGSSELAVLVSGSILLYRKMNIMIDMKELSISLLLAIPYVIPLLLVKTICGYPLLSLILGIGVTCLVFILNNMVIRENELLRDSMESIRKRIRK